MMNKHFKTMNMKNILIPILFMLISSFHLLYGQGWDRNYGREGSDWFFSLVETGDNGYLALGSSRNPMTNIDELFLQKTDVDGNEQWSRFYSESNDNLIGTSLLLTTDGGIMIMALNSTDQQIYLLKTDGNGIKEWSNQFNYGGYSQYPAKILQAADGGHLLTNVQNNRIWYGKVSALGVEEWSYTIQEGPDTNLLQGDIEILSDGYLVCGANKLVKLDLFGEEVWVQTFGATDVSNMIPLSDGNFMLLNRSPIVGYNLSKRSPNGNEIWNAVVDIDPSILSPIPVQLVETDENGFILVELNTDFSTSIIKTNSIGIEEWKKDIGPVGLSTFFLLKDSSGNLIFAGRNVYDDSGDQPIDAFLMKTDQQGNLYSNHILGSLFKDDNQNCNFEEGIEDGLANRIVQISGNKTFYGTTNEMGNYHIPVDTGTYEVSFMLTGPYWETCDLQPLNISEFNTDTTIDLAAQPIETCPWLTVDIGTPFLRRCFDNTYYINYCNQGTISAEDAYIEVSFDPFLEVQSSSLPWSSQIENVYTFDVGILEIGECRSFNVTTYLNCDSTILGQTHCTEAHIFPDSICLPDAANWDGSSIEVEAECDVDSVRFQINNIGTGNMQEALDYIIIEDEIMVHQGDFQLNAGQSEIIPNGFSSNGSTYRINHPGNRIPTAAIEGCGTTTFSVGFFNMFSQGDGDFYLSIDCQENIGAFDPNDKQAFPKGYGEENFIWPNTDIEYLIRFQNTGTDTAFTVVVIDTISQSLDVSSLQMGAASHPYNFTIDGTGVLKVTFNNILLPDSTTNELASHGFFKYKIKQQPDLPIGTMIYNEAGIYFDFNEPIITNETFHEVAEPFISVLVTTNDLTTNNIKLNAFPNPFGELTTFEIENLPAGRTEFILYDNLGRLIRKEQVVDGDRFQFYRKGLPSGLYFYEFQQNGRRIANGKMLAN